MRILDLILDMVHADDFLSMEYFMKKYQVSKRTLQNDLSFLSRISSQKGFQLQHVRGRGYLLRVYDEKAFHEYVATFGDSSNDHHNRLENIFAYLLLQSDFVTMEVIADAFDISVSLLKKERDAIIEMAERFHLAYESKTHHGIRITGSYSDIKDAVAELYFYENPLIKKEVDHQAVHGTYQKIEERLIGEFKIHDFNINYSELKNITVWLRVTIYMNLRYATPVVKVKKAGDAFYDICSSVLNEIYKVYDIGFQEYEAEAFHDLIQSNIRKKVPEVCFSARLQVDIDEFLASIDQEYQTAFNEDQDFKKLLLTHVSLLVDRLHQKISYKNTLIDEICFRYPMSFNIAIRFCDMLSEKYQVTVTHDEIGFVATHFVVHMEKESRYKMKRFNKIGVVCSSGGGSAYLIKMKIESLFEEADVRTFSLMDMKDLTEYQPDIIFTIKELDIPVQVPVIYIKELLDDTDLLRIKEVLHFDMYDSFSLDDGQPYYTSLFQKEFFEIVDDDKEYLDILKEMAEQIEASGYGGKGYCQYVLERESYMNTIYVNGICLPHPIEMCAEKNLISVKILKRPILYEHKQARMIFMISLTKDGYEILKDITRKLYELMNNDRLVNELGKSASFEEFMAVMKAMG